MLQLIFIVILILKWIFIEDQKGGNYTINKYYYYNRGYKHDLVTDKQLIIM